MKQQKSKLQTSKKQISKQLKKLKPKKNNVAFYLSVILVIFIIVAFVYMYIEKTEPEVTETPTIPDETPTEDITTSPPDDDPDDDSNDTSETSRNLYETLCIIFLTLGSTLSVYTLTDIMMKMKGGRSLRKGILVELTSVNTPVSSNTNLQDNSSPNSITELQNQDSPISVNSDSQNASADSTGTDFSTNDKIRKFIRHFFFFCIFVTYIVLSFLRDQLDPSKQTSEGLVITFQVTSITFFVLYAIHSVLVR